MNKEMTQEERLDYLVEKFVADSQDYKGMPIPDDIDEKERILRSLMNIRMPRAMDKDVVDIQDEYLRGRIQEIGVVGLGDIPLRRGCLSLWQGDITRLEVDAIVNAANSQMLGCFVPMHTCIDNCIHTFAGIELRQECYQKMKELRGRFGENYEQPTGIPMLTDAYNLPAKKVIHVVGPIVEYGLTPEIEGELAKCYRNVLDLCLANNLRSVAFCCISTGVFGFPNKPASRIAVKTGEEWLLDHPNGMDRVIFNVFKNEDRRYYEELL